MIDGVLSDLDPRRFQTFDELYRYCYQVASVVGLTVIHIFGFDTRSALPLSRKVRRGVPVDQYPARYSRRCGARPRLSSRRGFAPFGVSEDDLRAGNRNEPFLRMMRFEAARARAYYNESQPLLDLIHPRSRPSLWALVTIYSSLLERIERSNYDVFRRRVRLSALEKSWIVVRALVT
jgi:phytoene synthase